MPTRHHSYQIVDPKDPRLVDALENLVAEYHVRYGDLPGHDARAEVFHDLNQDFLPEHGGAFLAMLEDGETVVAMGALRRYEAGIAEFKKLWSHPERRGQRLASRLLARLEAEARNRGYRTVFLTTGASQPAADRLYERSGYTAHFDPEKYTVHPYTKALVDDADGTVLPASAAWLLEIDFAALVASDEE